MTTNDGISNDLQGTETGQFQQASEGSAQQVPEYITKSDFEAAIARLEQSFQRLAQSQADKSVAGLRKSVEKRLAEFMEFAKEAGVPQSVVDAEQQRIWMEVLDEHRSGGHTAPAAQQDVVMAVNEWIMDIADELGVAPLYPKDPEFAQVDFNNPDPEKFKAQYERAIRAKAARRHGVQNAPQYSPAARAPMASSGQPSGNPTIEQLTEQLIALQRKADRTAADWKLMKELESKIAAQLPKR